jgi:ribosomal protein L11 methyltransferase
MAREAVPRPGTRGASTGPGPRRRWLLVSVPAPPRGEELLLIDALRRVGARSVEREGERFVGRIPAPPDVAALLRDAERVVRASTSLHEPGLRWRWQDHHEWADHWTRGLPPRRVTDRIVVAPAGVDVDSRPDDIVIRLQPGAAFGTAEHPTTRMCLRFLDRLVRPGDRLADIGTGSGILAIAAARLGATHVLALEADPVACEDARTNVLAGGVADRVRVRELEVTAGRARRLGRFHGVAVNLQWDLLRPLLPALAHTLADDAWLIVAGLLVPERDPFLEAARASGLYPRDDMMEAGWWAGRLARP